MTLSQLGKRERTRAAELGRVYPHLATLLLLGIGGLLVAVGVSWFLGQPSVTNGFASLNTLQHYPPLGLQVPFTEPDMLLAPTIGLLLIVFGVMTLSPTPQPWSRWMVASILLLLTGRYLLWRSLSSLNLSTPLNGTFSLVLLGFELITILASVLQLLLLFRMRDRHRAADRLSQDVLSGQYVPSVDIFIPTYDEPEFILRRTVIGCQALDYPHKTVYLLDDTRRPAVHALAQELGCRYITRPDNRFAKAGNLNHAIAHSTGDLIAVFDADFVPTRNFLTRTIGFFQRPDIALIQTPQSFYNIDPVTRNLGLDDITPPEEETFYAHIQPMKDGAGGVVCAGTSFVVRRSALEGIGGFETDSLSEDYFTAIRLAAKGYQVIYLNEKLSAGLAAENMAAQAMQRIRWAQGTLQAFFISANPLTISGLTLMQRLAHLEGLLNWFAVVSRVVFLLMPLAYAFLGVIPLQTTAAELVYFFLPYYLVQLCVFTWLNGRSRSAFLSDVYSVVLCFPLAVVVVRAMLRPFGKGFKVTPKGTASHQFVFNWSLAWPLLVLFMATAVSLWMIVQGTIDPWGLSTGNAAESPPFGLGWFWSAYNLFVLSLGLLALIDTPHPHKFPWFTLQRVVKLHFSIAAEQGAPHNLAYRSATLDTPHETALLAKTSAQQRSIAYLERLMTQPPADVLTSIRSPERVSFLGTTTRLSEEGVEIQLTQPGFTAACADLSTPVTVHLVEDGLVLCGRVVGCPESGDYPVVRVSFQDLSLKQRRQLVELLFCRPGQWKRIDAPNEIQAVLCMIRALLKPRILFERSPKISAISVHNR